jgi:hypothetical protein
VRVGLHPYRDPPPTPPRPWRLIAIGTWRSPSNAVECALRCGLVSLACGAIINHNRAWWAVAISAVHVVGAWAYVARRDVRSARERERRGDWP